MKSEPKMWKVTLLATLLCGMFAASNAANILAVFPFPGTSQYILVKNMLLELAKRGHQVTSINAYPQKKPVANFTDISISQITALTDDIVDDFLSEPQSDWSEIVFLEDCAVQFTEMALNNTNVQRLINSKQKFDLVIVETFLNEALFGLAEHFGGAHLVGVSSFGTASFVDVLIGNPSPPSYTPNAGLPYTHRMTYMQRLHNLYRNTLEVFIWHTLHLPKQQALYRKYLPKARHPLEQVVKNFSLVLLNQHFSLSFSRPYVANAIEVGGMQLKRQPDPLPKDMQRFLDESEPHGVIYFSLGSNVKSASLPKATRDAMLRTFASLKQRVMWKFEDTNLPGKPPNVYISKWFPQADILAHPNVKLFITHGGLLSSTETIYHAKPALGIPFLYDQFVNVERMIAAGIGLHIDIKNFQEEEFKAKILELLNNPVYTQNIRKMSATYRDQPMTPLETAVYWVEYVLRHNGASHMRCVAQDLNFFQYHSLDTMAVLYGGFILAVSLVFYLLYGIASAFLSTNYKTKKVKKVKKN